jgi:hypothetical protein
MDLRDLAKSDPDKFRLRVKEWLETKPLTELATSLDVPYSTLYRICVDLGVKVGRAPVAEIPISDWATKGKKQIADEYGILPSSVYNYWQYHKAELEEGIRVFRREVATPGVVVGGTQHPEGGPEALSDEHDGGLSSSTGSTLDGDETGEDGD